MNADRDPVPLRWIGLGAGGVAALVGAATVAIGPLANVGLLLGAAAALVAAGLVVYALGRGQRSHDWATHFQPAATRRGADTRVNLIGTLVVRADAGDPDAGRLVHEVIANLADERLRHHHGIDRHERPTEAQALLGPELTAYLAHRPVGTLPIARATAYITQLEALS